MEWMDDGISGDNELVGIDYENESFALEIRKRRGEYLIKPEKSTRPLDVNRIKRALAQIAKDADLEIIHENISFSPHKPPLAQRYNKKIEDFENPDFGGRKIAVEVGFGSGRHLLYQAKNNPDMLFIGIEIHTPSAQQVLRQIEIQGLNNIWIVNYDARLLLEMLPSNSAAVIYVHFPVPWDKKPHRRVINTLFAAEAMRVLERGGGLELRTDSDNYYMYARDVLSGFNGHMEISKNSEAPIRSKYEDRWQRQEKDIYTIRLYSDEESRPLHQVFDFSFYGDPRPISELLRLESQAILKPDHFVHFERRYILSENNGVIIKCSFGSFDRPEHKFIIVSESGVFYYPQIPVRSSVNSNAHQTIRENIYV
jgi:tRNA (guanine-N7-)-methyltransferase